jgi:hypothetical protein
MRGIEDLRIGFRGQSIFSNPPPPTVWVVSWCGKEEDFGIAFSRPPVCGVGSPFVCCFAVSVAFSLVGCIIGIWECVERGGGSLLRSRLTNISRYRRVDQSRRAYPPTSGPRPRKPVSYTQCPSPQGTVLPARPIARAIASQNTQSPPPKPRFVNLYYLPYQRNGGMGIARGNVHCEVVLPPTHLQT